MQLDIALLQERLGYLFRDPSLARLALTHRSAARESNERLEFLGDAALGLTVARLLFDLHAEAAEGDLSRMRANLVNRDVLAELAIELDLSRHLLLGAGERKSGGKRRVSILADAMEALIGAVYLDGGLEQAAGVVRRLYEDRLATRPAAQQAKDPKTRLQEYLQARGLPLPDYSVVEISGEAHDQTFRVRCRVVPLESAEEGCGRSKRLAEQDAADRTLRRLGVEP